MGLDMYLEKISKKVVEYKDLDLESVKTQTDIEELLNTCKLVLENSKLVDGEILAYQTLKDGEWVKVCEKGKVIENTEYAEEYLPTQEGFFFGGTRYDEYYLENIKDTIEILTKVLDETDFINEAILYTSSW